MFNVKKIHMLALTTALFSFLVGSLSAIEPGVGIDSEKDVPVGPARKGKPKP